MKLCLLDLGVSDVWINSGHRGPMQFLARVTGPHRIIERTLLFFCSFSVA